MNSVYIRKAGSEKEKPLETFSEVISHFIIFSFVTWTFSDRYNHELNEKLNHLRLYHGKGC